MYLSVIKYAVFCMPGSPQLETAIAFKYFPMLGRFLLVSISILISNVAFTTHSLAKPKSSDVCNLTQVNSGELVTQRNTLPTKLLNSSDFGGSPTEIFVTCRQPARLSVLNLIQVAGPKFKPVFSLVSIENNRGVSTNSRGGSPLSLPKGTTPLKIYLSVDKGSPLEAGDYRYDVKFAIMSN